MSDIPKRRLGSTDVEVTVLGLGGAPLGNLFEQIPEDDALTTVESAHAAGIGWFDTAPFYGHGVSEHRFGHILRRKPRDGFVLSTKTGRLLRPARGAVESPFKGDHQFEVIHDYTYDATMRSVEDSLQRLGMSRIDVALIHDVDPMHQGGDYDARFEEASRGACKALRALKSEDVIRAWGIGVNEVGPCLRFGRETGLDCVMLARSYTLLEQTGVPDLLDLAAEMDFSLLIAGPFGSGILASGSESAATHNYAAASRETLDRVKRIEAVCRDHDVPLRAAALRFPLGHPRVAAVAVGAVRPDQAAENADLITRPIPDAFWEALKARGLIGSDIPTPRAAA